MSKDPWPLLWWRVLVSRPLWLGYLAVVSILLVLGGQTIPLVGEAGDARILWYGGAALGTLAAQAVTPRGIMWAPWGRGATMAHRLVIWGAMILALSLAGFVLPVAVHGAPWANALGVFLICWSITVALWRRGLDLASPLAPFCLIVALQIGAASSPFLDSAFEPRGGMVMLAAGSVLASVALFVPSKTT